uniref:leukocyte immunoglobulin-like receptor subfamily B member 3 isoform X1 n=1 Tax=Pristiophorus japonicus TaxID=55135 RepID=UPI00398F72D5
MFTLSVVLGMVHMQVLTGQNIHDSEKPTLHLNPHYGVFLKGENINLKCHCRCPLTTNNYYNSDHFWMELDPQKGQCETSFNLTAEKGYEGGYTCECLLSENGQWIHSKRSDPVQIVVRESLLVPTIDMDPDSGTASNGNNVAISCKGDVRSGGGTFHLYKDRKGNPVQSRTVTGGEQIVTFTINTRSEGSGGNYSCRYQTEVVGHSRDSPFSKDVAITEKDADNGLLLNVGLGCGVVIIVLLFVAIICLLIIKRRQRRRQNNKRSRASAGGVTSAEDADNTYDTANHPSHPDTNGVYSEVPESDHQEITYATLNMGVVNRKEAALVTAAETSMYADVKKK